MWEIALIGVIGGLVTGVSPCVLPVLPVVLAVSAGDRRRPYLIAVGIALGFAVITLLGTLVIHALGLPGGFLRWAGIIMLALVGLGMLVPQLGDLLERPFSRIRVPRKLEAATRSNRGGRFNGLGVGLALGAVYVPCAGPVLAAVTVAGSTGDIGVGTVVLTVTFSVGAALPLLLFALAGQGLSGPNGLLRKYRTTFTRVAGVLVLVLAVAVAVDLPQTLQRNVPDWTASVQDRFNSDDRVQDALSDAKPSRGDGSLDECRSADAGTLSDCGEAPEFEGLENWFNTDEPVALGNKVTLVDFWAYACINCQRNNEHLTEIYDNYRDAGLEVVGVHAPEYSFEHDIDNVRSAAAQAGINYPVAQDNNFETWNAYGNRYWPAHYLVDTLGNVRQIHEGEGEYADTEKLIRELLTDADPNVRLPDPVESDVGSDADSAQSAEQDEDWNPETYLGTDRAEYQANDDYTEGEHDFTPYRELQRPYFTLSGRWKLSAESITPAGPGATVTLDYRASVVQVVTSGSGTLTVTDESGRREVPASDGSVDLVRSDTDTGEEVTTDTITLEVPEGVSLFSFTFG